MPLVSGLLTDLRSHGTLQHEPEH